MKTPTGTDPAIVGQWPKIARNWNQMGSPLRPSAEDLAFVNAAINDWSAESSSPARALILGVTPELYHAQWPVGSKVNATDWTIEMIENVWPGDRAQVKHSSWLVMDWPTSSFDIVLCDGGLHLLTHPRDQSQLMKKLCKIVAPGGKVLFRLFALPERRENPKHVIRLLLERKIPNLNCLKLRLGMALQDSPVHGVALEHIWRYLRESCGEWPSLASRLDWPLEHLSAIDAYKDSIARYYFLSTADTIDLICHGQDSLFRLEKIDTPKYLMGRRCPTVTFHRIDDVSRSCE